jgi:hypothetical protein
MRRVWKGGWHSRDSRDSRWLLRTLPTQEYQMPRWGLRRHYNPGIATHTSSVRVRPSSAHTISAWIDRQVVCGCVLIGYPDDGKRKQPGGERVVADLKRQYKQLRGSAPRGPLASNVAWLQSKIAEARSTAAAAAAATAAAAIKEARTPAAASVATNSFAESAPPSRCGAPV